MAQKIALCLDDKTCFNSHFVDQRRFYTVQAGVIRVRIADMVNESERATRLQSIEYRREKFCGSIFALAVIDVVKVECRKCKVDAGRR